MNEYCLCEELYRTRFQNESEPAFYVDDEFFDFLGNMTIPLENNGIGLKKLKKNQKNSNFWTQMDMTSMSTSTVIMVSMYVMIMVIGIPLNLIVLCVAAAFRRNAPCSSFLLVNMAIQDLLILFTTLRHQTATV